MRLSIKTKSTLFIGILLIFAVGLLSFIVLDGLKKYQVATYEEVLNVNAKNANNYIEQSFISSVDASSEMFLKRNAQKLAVTISMMSGLNTMIYDMSGDVTGQSLTMVRDVDLEKVKDIALDGKRTYLRVENMLYYFSPVYYEKKQIGLIAFRYSIKEYIDFYDKIQQLFINTGAVVFLISFLLGNVFFMPFSKDILKLKRAVQKIKTGEFAEIESFKRKDEIGELCEGIRSMQFTINHQLFELESEKEKLEYAIVELEKMKHQQKRFIGDVSHEFKTPMTSIIAYVDLLKMYKDDPSLIEDAVKSIGSESKRLLSMVENVLDLSKADQYDFEFEQELIKADQVLDEICTSLNGKALKEGIGIYTELEPVELTTDKKIFTQVFINLIDNALKYTDSPGEVHVTLKREENNAVVYIADTGIGIPEEYHEKVFDPFFTVNADRARKISGTGLGLAMVKKFVEMQNGHIKILKSDESGTTFCVEFSII